MLSTQEELYQHSETGGGIAFESAIDAIRSISDKILVPYDFLPLILPDDPNKIVEFQQTGARGVVLFKDRNPFGRVIIGGSPNKPDGTQVIVSGVYEQIQPTDIQVDYLKIGERTRVRTTIGYENFLFVKRIQTEMFKNRGAWGYAFWVAE